MLVNEYTLPQLVDLALRVPEIGAVNFNILHTVMLTIISELDLTRIKPWCHIENSAVARAALTKSKLKAPPHRRAFSTDNLPTTRPALTTEFDLTPAEGGPQRTRRVRVQNAEMKEGEEYDSAEDEEFIDEQTGSTSSTGPQRTEWHKETLELTRVDPGRMMDVDDDVVHEIGKAKEAEMTTEMWRATNLNRRMEAAEEGLEKFSFIVDRMADRLNEIKDVSTDHEALERLNARCETLEDELKSLKESFLSSDDFRRLSEQIERLEHDKTDEPAVEKIIEAECEEVHKELEEMKQRLAELHESLKNVLASLGMPPMSTTEELLPEEPPQPPDTINERFDEIWKELDDILNKLKSVGPGGPMFDVKKFEEQERLLRSLADQIETARNRIELLEADARRKDKLIEGYENELSNLQFSKADKDAVEAALDLKADKRDLDGKVDRAEFIATIEDLGESITIIAEKLRAIDEEFRAILMRLEDEVKKKLSIEDYNTLQQPILNRIKALMYALKKLKSVINSTLFPDAAGITKCVSCGRPAELAGSKCTPSGDPPVQPPEQTHLPGDLTPPPSSEDDNEKSFISLPEQQLSTNKNLESKLFAPSAPDVGLRMRKPKHETDDELKRLVATQPKTRFCGGEYTVTAPNEKGIRFDPIALPPRDKDNVTLSSYNDSSWYKGSIPKDKYADCPIELDTNTMDDELDALADFPDDAPVQKYMPPRYCGGKHTMTATMQKGIPFANFKIPPNPLEQQMVVLGSTGQLECQDSDFTSGIFSDDGGASLDSFGRPTQTAPNLVSLPSPVEQKQIFSQRRGSSKSKTPNLNEMP